MADITELLLRARTGEPERLAEVFSAVYPELRRLAGSCESDPRATLTPTVLVHEIFLRLTATQGLELVDRRHFFACAARAMRRVAVDHARKRGAAKRGGRQAHIDLDEESLPADGRQDMELLSLDRALDELALVNPRQRDVVELHFFAGLGFAEVGELLGCVERTAKREWERARAFLHSRIE